MKDNKFVELQEATHCLAFYLDFKVVEQTTDPEIIYPEMHETELKLELKSKLIPIHLKDKFLEVFNNGYPNSKEIEQFLIDNK